MKVSQLFRMIFLSGVVALMSTAAKADLAEGTALDALRDSLQSLKDSGVELRAQIIDEFASNPVGGVHRGGTNVGQFSFGADFDLDKIAGIQGGQIHTTIYRDYGDSLSLQSLGTSFKVQEIYKNPYNHLHFGVLTYDQKLLDDRLYFIVGRTGTTSIFGRLKEFCDFENGAECGVPVILKSQSGFTLLPSATWEGTVSYNFTPDVSLMAGAFEVNPFIAHTWGMDFATTHATGVTVPIEVAYKAKETKYPLTVKFGEVYSDGAHTDPFYNTAGKSYALSKGKQEQIAIRNTVYGLADKTVWHTAQDASRGISLFGGYVRQLDQSEIYSGQLIAGTVWTGPFASRPRDTLGFVGNYLRVTSREIEYLRDSRIKAGGHGINYPNEFPLELNYGIAVTPGVRFTPSVQYIIHPDNAAIPATKTVPQDAWVLGIKLTINFGGLIGLSTGDVRGD